MTSKRRQPQSCRELWALNRTKLTLSATKVGSLRSPSYGQGVAGRVLNGACPQRPLPILDQECPIEALLRVTPNRNNDYRPTEDQSGSMNPRDFSRGENQRGLVYLFMKRYNGASAIDMSQENVTALLPDRDEAHLS